MTATSPLTPPEIAAKAVTLFNRRITNEIFLTIQNDRELMQAYLRSVAAHGLDPVNQQIGKAVKELYQLVNVEEREENPTCTLIGSHQIFG